MYNDQKSLSDKPFGETVMNPGWHPVTHDVRRITRSVLQNSYHKLQSSICSIYKPAGPALVEVSWEVLVQ